MFTANGVVPPRFRLRATSRPGLSIELHTLGRSRSEGVTHGRTLELNEGTIGAISVRAELRVRPGTGSERMPNRDRHEALYAAGRERVKDVPIVTLDDLRWADGIVWGTPTRYGNMCAQMKRFIDGTAALWSEGALEGKPTGLFTSSGTLHGGQESTILTALVPLLHLGMIFVGTPYGDNPHMMDATRPMGGSPYDASTIAAGDPDENVQVEERRLDRRVAGIAARLADA